MKARRAVLGVFLFSFCIGLVGVPSASATFATQGERIAFFRTPARESGD